MTQFLVPVVLTLLLLVVVIVFLVVGAFKPQLKGWLGESVVHGMLSRNLDPATYKIVRDVMLPVDDATTQIDHIVVSRFGIFVIETKTMKGWIFGSEADAKWTQQLFRKKCSFQNPIRQNYRHTKTLAELTTIPDSYFKSVIAFSGEAVFKTPMPAHVLHIRDLCPFISSFRDVIIQDEQVPEIVAAISEWAGTVSAEKRAQHVANLKRRMAPVSATAQPPTCARCGSVMVLRTRKKDASAFWGCSSYPGCHHILACGDQRLQQ